MARGDDLRSVAAAATVCRHPSHGTVDTSTITTEQRAANAAAAAWQSINPCGLLQELIEA